jgi:cholesterol transport system auxiliary component
MKRLAIALAVFLAALLPALLAGCGGVFESSLASPQTYVLRLPASAAASAEGLSAASAGSVLVRRPEAGPGLDSNRIALLRSDRRFDFYAASLWAAPAPDVMESVVINSLRGTGAFTAVFDDASPFVPGYDLRITMRRFEADYTNDGRDGSRAPTVHVVLDCTLGRRRDRALLTSFTAQGSALAAEDRLGSVVAAFEAATAGAMAELTRTTTAAIAAEKPLASEGR